MDQTGFFQDGYEDPGGNHSPLRIDPPGQGFHAAEFARKAADHRLVIHLDMTGLEGLGKVFDHKGADLQPGTQFRSIEGNGLEGIFFDGITGGFGHVEGLAQILGGIVFLGRIDPRLQLDVGIADQLVHLPDSIQELLFQALGGGQQYKAVPGQPGQQLGGKMALEYSPDGPEQVVPGLDAPGGVVQLEIGQVEINGTEGFQLSLLFLPAAQAKGCLEEGMDPHKAGNRIPLQFQHFLGSADETQDPYGTQLGHILFAQDALHPPVVALPGPDPEREEGMDGALGPGQGIIGRMAHDFQGTVVLRIHHVPELAARQGLEFLLGAAGIQGEQALAGEQDLFPAIGGQKTDPGRQAVIKRMEFLERSRWSQGYPFFI